MSRSSPSVLALMQGTVMSQHGGGVVIVAQLFITDQAFHLRIKKKPIKLKVHQNVLYRIRRNVEKCGNVENKKDQ